jgi:hypothetical protein
MTLASDFISPSCYDLTCTFIFPFLIHRLVKRKTHRPRPVLLVRMEDTLVHCFENAESERLCTGSGQYSREQIFKFCLPADDDAQQSGRRTRFTVAARPGAVKYMLDLSEHFELHVFTKATREYADPILDWFEGGNELFRSRGYQQEAPSQNEENPRCVLDIARLLGVSEMDRVLVLDSNEDSCPADQTANWVPIVHFRGDNNDSEFMTECYKRILIKASKLGDIRHGITEEFRELIRNKRSGHVVSTTCMCGMHEDSILCCWIRHTHEDLLLLYAISFPFLASPIICSVRPEVKGAESSLTLTLWRMIWRRLIPKPSYHRPAPSDERPMTRAVPSPLDVSMKSMRLQERKAVQ